VSRRWLVAGANGMLGRDLLSVLDGREVTAAGRAELDITDPLAVRAAVVGHDVVINAAAWTDVDGAESAEVEATAVNGLGPAHLAVACADFGSTLIHVSTDYVFAGTAQTPYSEDAATGPVNAYGRSKLAGEAGVIEQGGFVVRTAWLYGEHGRNFVATMLELAAKRDTLNVVDDQRGQPTWSLALAHRLVALAEAALAGTAPPGVYHGTAAGETTKFGLARAVFAAAGLDPERVRPTTSDAFPTPAARPCYSVLGHARWADIGMGPMEQWENALEQALHRPRFVAAAEAARAAAGASTAG
jgi:dTDP-4-dehydrorhamnose reductase